MCICITCGLLICVYIIFLTKLFLTYKNPHSGKMKPM